MSAKVDYISVPADLAGGQPEDLAAVACSQPRFAIHRVFAVGGVCIGAACAAVIAAKPWAYPGAEPLRLRANIEQIFREYDEFATGSLPMPESAGKYDGIEDKREFLIDTSSDMSHVFVIGDWGALLPDHQTAACKGSDCTAQFQVANAMKDRNKWAHAQYVLNVGDAFYWGGVDVDCNAPPKAAWGKAKSDFASVWQGIYAELAGVPWISTLGNHDYGGYRGDKGWPQQIGYSFVNHNWIMPARYFKRKVQHKDWVAEYFVIDSNVFDAKSPGDEPGQNLCSHQHTPPGANCGANDGMPDIWGCKDWFWSSYGVQKTWLEEKLKESTARWKIVVTHFPCGYDGSWYRNMFEKYGLDLLVTGHRHQQELWFPGTTSNYVKNLMSQNDLGDLPCIMSGGGGGIVSENFNYADYGRDLQTFGFFDLTMAKDWMNVELVGTDRIVRGNVTVKPHDYRMNIASPVQPFSPKLDEESAERTRSGSTAKPAQTTSDFWDHDPSGSSKKLLNIDDVHFPDLPGFGG